MHRIRTKTNTIYFVLLASIVAFAIFIGLKPSMESKPPYTKINDYSEETYTTGTTLFSRHKLFLDRLYDSDRAAEQASKEKDKEIVKQVHIPNTPIDATKAINVSVLLQEENTIETIPLEDYVLYVTLHELPWSFHDEAVKAQMIAARTYIMYRLNNSSDSKEYDVTDSTTHQVYRFIDEARLTEKEKEQLKHFKGLLEETKGKIITYNNEPIDALYFSTSNGKTESAEYYFNQSVPYLQSVISKWDKSISPSYTKQFEFTFDQFFTRLKAATILDKGSNTISIETVERSSSNRLLTISINKQEVSARKLREALGLASTDFKWTIHNKDKRITFTTTGYGHGVGLSQWGAEGMARDGYKAVEILKHYYTDIEVGSL